MDITRENDLDRKPAVATEYCEGQLDEAIKYIEENSPKQAEIMRSQFFKTLRQLEKTPWIGRPYKNGMRMIKLGKFRYNIYYRENEDNIDILGIWHTSRGTEFEEQCPVQ